jgi:cell division protein FtsL
VVGKNDPAFQLNALAGALTRVVADQQEELSALKKEVKKLSANPR